MTDLSDLLLELTLEEKIRLLGGRDWWHTEPIERLGIPSMHLSDGPVGVRGARSVGTTSVSFPCGTAIGATFDPDAAAELADALADECLDKGVHMLLGPTINLQRHPLGGRHFECYSEDPWLTAELCVAYVRALQARGISATVKHYIANDTEYQRHTISSEVSDDVLRRAYLVPFEEAVVRATPWAVMSSYNRINGTYAAEHEELLQGVLRDDFGFDGLVVSDWFGAQSTAPSVNAGNDLEMPGPPVHYGAKLAEAVASGEVSEQTIDLRAREVLRLAERTNAAASERPAPRRTVDARRAVSRSLAARSIVLLTNTRNPHRVLPLHLAAGTTLAVVGPNAAATAFQGGGSAQVHPVRVVSILEGLRAHYEPLGVEVVHEIGCRGTEDVPPLDVPVRIEYRTATDGPAVVTEEHPRYPLVWNGEGALGIPGLGDGQSYVRTTSSYTAEIDGPHLFTVSQVGASRVLVDGKLVVEGGKEPGKRFFRMGSADTSGEMTLEAGRTYEVVVDMQPLRGVPFSGLFLGITTPLPSDDELIERAVAAAERADAVICVVGTTTEWESEGRDRRTMDLPGRQDDLVSAVAAVNRGTVVIVNAASPVTMDWVESPAAIAQVWFPGERAGEAVADVIAGVAEPGGRLPHTIPIHLSHTPAYPYYPGTDGVAPYGEGLQFGYRGYASRQVAPRFWFGHGLAYTSFEIGDPSLETGTSSHQVRADVRNVGSRAGSEVAQVYIENPSDEAVAGGEPRIQFAGSARVTLEPGASAPVVIDVPARLVDRLPAGTYRVCVGHSADPATQQTAGEIVVAR